MTFRDKRQMENPKRKLRDELDDPQKMQVRKFAKSRGKWTEYFLIRFHEQAKKHDMTNREICEAIKDKEILELLPNYELLTSTLSQYTNVNSKSLRTVNVDALIALSKVFGVSIDYLLGIEEKENHEETDIYKATGLNTNTIEILKNNHEMGALLNFSASSNSLQSIIKEVSRLRVLHSLHEGLLSECGNYKEKIETAIMKFCDETHPIGRNIDIYTKYLRREMSVYQSIYCTYDDLLKDIEVNLSRDKFYAVTELVKGKTNKNEIFDDLINFLAELTYDLVECKYQEGAAQMKISQDLSLLITGFINVPYDIEV